jgi:hypothetical protein
MWQSLEMNMGILFVKNPGLLYGILIDPINRKDKKGL